MKNEQNIIKSKIILIVLRLIVSYFKYACLGVLVIISLLFLLAPILSFSPHFSFEFLKYFAFIDPKYGYHEVSMDQNDILRLFSFVSLLFMIIAEIVKMILKIIFKININFSIKKRAVTIVLFLTTIFVIASISVSIKYGYDPGIQTVFSAFYAISLVFTVFYLVYGYIIEKINRTILNPV